MRSSSTNRDPARAGALLLLVAACSAAPMPTSEPGTRQFKAEAWADNWFALYQGDVLLGEDSVPITTVRSFNAETFTFAGSYPLSLAFVVKDYVEDATGLEYIGTPNQQIGDGGFSFQLTDLSTGRVVMVSSSAWRCLAIARAPLDPGCAQDADPRATCQAEVLAEPDGWKEAAFEDAAWPAAVEYTAAEVGPKEGYLEIDWDARARLIWTSDLQLDNTLLCRITVPAP